MDEHLDIADIFFESYNNCRKLFIIENKVGEVNSTTASLPPTDSGFQTLHRIIRDDLGLCGDVQFFSKDGTEMNTEDFFHIGNNEVLYVKNKEEGSTKFSYKSLLSLYKNLGLLGEGGYGTVYLLEHSISK